MENITELLIPFQIWIHTLFPPTLIQIMKGITFLGNTEFYLIFMPMLYWCLDTVLGIRIGVILLISGGLNNLFKLGFQSPRPCWLTPEIDCLAEASSFGFPSGHSQNAAAIWGLFATSRKNSWLKIGSVLLIFLIGLSRMILGVHFLHDVLFGWLVGGILLLAFIKLEPGVVHWFKQNPAWKQTLALVIITSLFILTAVIISPPFDHPILNTSFFEYGGVVIDPYSYDDLLTTTGALFGLGLGIIYLNQQGRFAKQGKIWQLVLRYLVGMIGVLVLYLGLGSIFPGGISLTAYFLRFFRYSLIGIWISYAAPQLFAWMKLATIETAE